MNLDNIDDAEKFQKHFVAPMVEAVSREIGPLVKRVESLEASMTNQGQRIQKLEGYAAKMMTVYSALVAALTFGVHWGWAKLKSKLS